MKDVRHFGNGRSFYWHWLRFFSRRPSVPSAIVISLLRRTTFSGEKKEGSFYAASLSVLISFLFLVFTSLIVSLSLFSCMLELTNAVILTTLKRLLPGIARGL